MLHSSPLELPVSDSFSGQAERKRLLQQYFDMYIVRAGEQAKGLFGGSAAKINVDADGIDEEYWDALALRTEGFSGRAISKMMLSVQGAVYGRRDASLNLELLDTVVSRKIKELHDKSSGFSTLFEH